MVIILFSLPYCSKHLEEILSTYKVVISFIEWDTIYILRMYEKHTNVNGSPESTNRDQWWKKSAYFSHSSQLVPESSVPSTVIKTIQSNNTPMFTCRKFKATDFTLLSLIFPTCTNLRYKLLDIKIIETYNLGMIF